MCGLNGKAMTNKQSVYIDPKYGLNGEAMTNKQSVYIDTNVWFK